MINLAPNLTSTDSINLILFFLCLIKDFLFTKLHGLYIHRFFSAFAANKVPRIFFYFFHGNMKSDLNAAKPLLYTLCSVFSYIFKTSFLTYGVSADLKNQPKVEKKISF